MFAPDYARFFQPLYEGDGGAGGANPPAPTPPANPTLPTDTLGDTPLLLDPDRFGALGNLVRKEGGVKRTAEVLFADNFRLRDARRVSDTTTGGLREELRLANEKVAGGTNLTPEDVQALEDFRKMGTPEEVTKKIEAATEAVTKVAQFEMRETLAKVAKVSGFDPVKVLEVVQQGVFAVRTVKETVDGKEQEKEQGVVVTMNGEEKVETPFDKYLAETYPSLVESLKSNGEDPVKRKPLIPVQRPGTTPEPVKAGSLEGVDSKLQKKYQGNNPNFVEEKKS